MTSVSALPRCRKLGYLSSCHKIEIGSVWRRFMPNFQIKPQMWWFLPAACRPVYDESGHHWAPLGTISPGARLINIDNKQIKCLGRIRICSGYVSICWGHSTWAVNQNWELAPKKTRELPLVIKRGKSHIYGFHIENSIFSDGFYISTVDFRSRKTWVNPAFLSYVKMGKNQQVNLGVSLYIPSYQ